MRPFGALALRLAPLLGALSTGTASSISRSRIGGLRALAHLVRDRFGVQHVIAHAQDRLFHMEVTRRQASGRRAELLGIDDLADDIQNRTVGLRRAAGRRLEVLSDEGVAAIEADREGVNAWVRDNPLPSEYAEVEVSRFEP